MDQFITTYQKDYTHPITRIKRKVTPLRESDSCRCRDRPLEVRPLTHCGDDYDWSRTGPMGRLLDPKLYPAKTGPHPETEATKYGQPGTYMRKLEQKYPNLYGILQSTPIDEVIKRVDQDRLKTTYQIDYSDRAAAQMEEIFAGPCAIRQQQEEVDCRPSARSQLIKRDKRDDKDKRKTKEHSKRSKFDEDSQETRLPPWRSEYQDSISRLGQAIMKYQIHHNRKEAPAWAMAIL